MTNIIEALKTNDTALCRALVVISEMEDGFAPEDADIGKSMAKFFSEKGYLTEKQLAFWKKTNVYGALRICKYAGKLLTAAEKKEREKKISEMTLDVFQGLLASHDWSYEYSDDHSVWTRGNVSKRAIQDALRMLESKGLSEQANRMYISHHQS